MTIEKHLLCEKSELPMEGKKLFEVEDEEILVIKNNDLFFAVSNICPHMKTGSIKKGFIKNDKISCPLHGWTFNLTDGKEIQNRSKLKTYPLEIIGDDVFVYIEKTILSW